MKVPNDRSIALIPILLSLLTLQSCALMTPQKQRGGSTISNAGYRLSEGDVAIFPEDGTFAKTQAMEAYGKGNYAQSQDFFKQSLQQRPNDPEALIYKNNAIAALSKTPPLRIGVSISGSADGSGSREVLRGAAQAQQELNLAGGLNGHLLSITIGTDNNDAQIAPQVAASFVERSEILGVVGHSASGVSLAATETYTQGKLVAISPVSSAVQLSNKSPYFFRTVPSDQVAAQALTKYMFETFKRQKAVVYFNSESSYSKSLKGELKTAMTQQGGQMVAEYDLAMAGLDFNATLMEAQQKGAEVILLASNTDSLDRALQIVRLNENRLPILGGDDVYSPKTLEVTREKGNNMVLAVPWHIQATTSQDFANRSRKLWGGDVNWRTATAYDATQALITALREAGLRSEPKREAVQQILRSGSFTASGASRPIVFQSSGDRDVPVQLVQITKGKRSGFGYDFQPIELSPTKS
jgi:branched-chain amino acid transport system substrate-binding protein